MYKKLNYYYEFVSKKSGSVYCGYDRKDVNRYDCVKKRGCFLDETGECSCSFEKHIEVPNYQDHVHQQKYNDYMSIEYKGGAYAKVKHKPLLMYIIHPKQSKTDKTEYMFVASDVEEVLNEMSDMNKRRGTVYWMVTPFEEYNIYLLELERSYNQELQKMNVLDI